jgi:mannosyltransferase
VGLTKAALIPLQKITVIAPHFKRRLSGVTSTVIQLVPEQVRLGRGIVTLGPGLPNDLPKMRWRQLPELWLKPEGARFRIWHARRNSEMLPGILLKQVLRMPLKLLFTSAAQRNHSGYTRWLIRQMDEVVATSARSGSFLKVSHTVIRHGIDLELFHPQGAEDTIEGTGLPGKYLIGCFGRVRHQKGTDLFVRAMVELLPHHPDWTAVVCGRVTVEHQSFGDELKAIVTKSGLADRIRFMGEVDDIKPWYRLLSLYVAPSRNEGFGLTPLEAMASGTAVVASDAGAYAEQIVSGETGAVTPAGNYEALRDSLIPYLADPALAEQHGQAGLRHVTQNFALVGEAKALEAIYSSLSR